MNDLENTKLKWWSSGIFPRFFSPRGVPPSSPQGELHFSATGMSRFLLFFSKGGSAGALSLGRIKVVDQGGPPAESKKAFSRSPYSCRKVGPGEHFQSFYSQRWAEFARGTLVDPPRKAKKTPIFSTSGGPGRAEKNKARVCVGSRAWGVFQ